MEQKFIVQTQVILDAVLSEEMAELDSYQEITNLAIRTKAQELLRKVEE